MGSLIRPIPEGHGVGFCSYKQLPEYASKYREEQVGHNWNYYFTADECEWPGPYFRANAPEGAGVIIDGFSPNLNKSLHVGHLRQLALAKSVRSLMGHKTRMVALLGASQGVYKYAWDQLNEWFEFINYKPEIYYDVLMPRDQDIVPRYKKMMPYTDPIARAQNVQWGDLKVAPPPAQTEQECTVWDGPKGPVIVERWDGRPTYAFHDIAFAKTVGPTHYITGAEQKEHFVSLGLGEKHLAMGLVLGKDGKKLKSRQNAAVEESATAEDAMHEVMERFDPTPEPRKLAWNVLAWNFLHVSRSQNVKFDPEEWTKPDSPGMYITYTFARVEKALKGLNLRTAGCQPFERKAHAHNFQFEWSEEKDKAHYAKTRQRYHWHDGAKEWSKNNPDPHYDLTPLDIELIGVGEYHKYWEQKAMESMDPASLANYTHDLARKLGEAYHKEKIQGGRYGFQYAMADASRVLRHCMWSLGMFDLKEV